VLESQEQGLLVDGLVACCLLFYSLLSGNSQSIDFSFVRLLYTMDI
jgi:hypothetical protein